MPTPRKIGLLLSSDKADPIKKIEKTTDVLFKEGHQLYAYLIHTGVRYLLNPVCNEWIQRGMHMHVCSLGATREGLPFSEKAVFCGLGSLASILQNTSLFYSFSSNGVSLKQEQGDAPVALAASESLENKNGNTLECLRTAAGLAQLSSLSIQLQLAGEALDFFEDINGSAHKREALDYLKLLTDAGGSLFLSRHATLCPVDYRISPTQDLLKTSFSLGIG